MESPPAFSTLPNNETLEGAEVQTSIGRPISGPAACGMRRFHVALANHPGPSAQRTRRSQNRSHPKPDWGPDPILALSERLSVAGCPDIDCSRLGVLPASLFFFFVFCLFSTFRFSARSATGLSDSMTGQRLLAGASWFMQDTGARERTPGVPADRWLKGETMLLDPRWPHGSSAGVAQRHPGLGENLSCGGRHPGRQRGAR